MTAALTACHECDLLQREIALRSKGTVRCTRCGALLYRTDPASVDRALAFAVGAAVLLVMANAFPLVGLRVKGELIQTTLFGAAQVLYDDGMRTLAAVVFLTTVAAPIIEIAAIISVLGPLRLKRWPRRGAAIYRVMRRVRPWGMVEVMMLGVLVALVKLAHIAEIVPGVALWSLAVLVVLTAACAVTFDPRVLWAQLDAQR